MLSSPTVHGRSLLAVFAHPDDESITCGGLLARCARSGVRVTLLCLTRGEAGPSSPAIDGGSEDLGTVRARELAAAAAVLGIQHVILRDHPDGMLPWLDARTLEQEIAEVIRTVAADVVVTFDEDGLYWHPDHIAVHERTRAAMDLCDGVVPALYFATMPAGCMRAVFDRAIERARGRGERPPRQVLGISNPDAFGADAPPPTVRLSVADVAGDKLAAIACHASQLHDDALAMLTTEDAAEILGVEQLRRDPRSTASFLESALS